MAFVDTEFEWNEVNWDRSLSVSTDLDVVMFAVEWIRCLLSGLLSSLGSKRRLLVFSILTRVRYFASSLSLGTNSSFNLFSSQLFSASSSLVEDSNLEEDVLRESILNNQVDLLRLV